MGVLTDDMKRVIGEQRLGFFATVSEDGSPNLSPKGSTYVLDDDRLFFADVRSPQTVANIRRGSPVEINVVDPFVRKGYRFGGTGAVHEPGSPLFDEAVALMRAAGSQLTDRVRTIVVIEVREARPLTSPAYDDGTMTEPAMRALHRARFDALNDPRAR
jgi:predicted pyridoxine 5'-phosphate oxidase superfamily flavin-nucleotide-binding protein